MNCLFIIFVVIVETFSFTLMQKFVVYYKPGLAMKCNAVSFIRFTLYAHACHSVFSPVPGKIA